MSDPLAYTIPQAAAAAAAGKTVIYAAIKAGELLARKRGRRTLILAVDLRAWLEKLPALELRRIQKPSGALSQSCVEQVGPPDKRRVDGAITGEREGRDVELELDTKARRCGLSKSKGHPTLTRGA